MERLKRGKIRLENDPFWNKPQMKSELPLVIEGRLYWVISPPADFTEFLRNLPALVPNDSILCLEGVIDSDIESFLKKRPANYDNETNQGFLKLHSKIFYMPITEENLRQFAELSKRYNELEICSHLRVYYKDRVILSWYDLPSDPLNLINHIDEIKLRNFCRILGCAYTNPN